MAQPVTAMPRHMVPTRQGEVAAQWYRPDGRVRRATLLVPGVHSMGIAEPRLTALAQDLAGSGVAVMTMALPDLIGYQITARSADVIEDAVKWMAAQPELAPDGRVGMVGISFAGGLSIVAAGRPSIRDKVAYVVSFGGHGDLGRVLKYLATGEAVQAPGVVTHPPHDYGVAVILYAGADRVVPPEQVTALRDGIGTFLLASQLTLVNMDQANATFQKARDMVKGLPEPSATLLTYVNDRNVKALGPILAPHLQLEADPAASPERAPMPPAAPVFLLHGAEDVVIPTAESVVLGDYLRSKGRGGACPDQPDHHSRRARSIGGDVRELEAGLVLGRRPATLRTRRRLATKAPRNDLHEGSAFVTFVLNVFVIFVGRRDGAASKNTLPGRHRLPARG